MVGTPGCFTKGWDTCKAITVILFHFLGRAGMLSSESWGYCAPTKPACWNGFGSLLEEWPPHYYNPDPALSDSTCILAPFDSTSPTRISSSLIAATVHCYLRSLAKVRIWEQVSRLTLIQRLRKKKSSPSFLPNCCTCQDTHLSCPMSNPLFPSRTSKAALSEPTPNIPQALKYLGLTFITSEGPEGRKPLHC